MPAHLRLTVWYLVVASVCSFVFPLVRPDLFRRLIILRLERPNTSKLTELPPTIRFVLLDSTRVSVRVFEISSTAFFIVGALTFFLASFIARAGRLYVFEYRLLGLFIFFAMTNAVVAGRIRWCDLGPYLPIPLNSDFVKTPASSSRTYDFNTQDVSRLIVFRMGEFRDLFKGRTLLSTFVLIWVYYPNATFFSRSNRWFYRLLSTLFIVYAVGGDGGVGDRALLFSGIFFVEMLLITLAALFSLQGYTNLSWTVLIETAQIRCVFDDSKQLRLLKQLKRCNVRSLFVWK
jgi:hypothetical protein